MLPLNAPSNGELTLSQANLSHPSIALIIGFFFLICDLQLGRFS